MNDKQTLTLEAGKYYRTRDGRKVCVGYIMTDSPFNDARALYPAAGWVEGDDFASCWNLDGSIISPDNEKGCDLVSEWVEPKRIKGWIAIGQHQSMGVPHFRTSNCFQNEELAKQKFREDFRFEADACVEIDVLEGHGLNGEAR